MDAVKYMKIQQEMMKAADKAEWKGKMTNQWFQYEYDGNQVVSDGHFLALIPNSLFFLDPVKSTSGKMPFEGAKKIVDDKYQTEPAKDEKTTEIATVMNKKLNLHKFKLRNGEEMYVDENLLKYFDLDLCKFTGTTKKNLLYIWYGDALVGAVLPVNYK